MPLDPEAATIDPIRFTNNRLLDLFSDELAERLRPHASYVRLEVGDVLFTAGQNLEHTYFPQSPTMISLLVDVDNDRTVEVASIGKEGAIGGIVSCGDLPCFTRAQVHVGGGALRLPLDKIEEAKRESLFLRDLYCRYADYLLAQVMQSVACSAFHSIEERASRWLLTAQDRSGDNLQLTQEALAGLLGVQRTTVNAIAKQLQEEGLIAYRRGKIEVKERDKLKARACECYDKVERHYAKVLDGSTAGWIADCQT